MGRPFSARVVLTAFATVITTVAALLIISSIRQSLPDVDPTALEDTTTAAWAVALFAIVLATAAAWLVTGALLKPIQELRRDTALVARARDEMATAIHHADSERRRLLAMFEGINEGIVQVGPGARFLHVNAAARALLGLPANAEGQGVAALVRHLELRELIVRGARGEVIPATEILLDGRQLLIAHQPLPAGPSEGGGAVMTVVDLTELRRLESVRRDFVANVSHELKTPLTSIRGYTETLISDEMPREVQLQFLDVVHKNTTRIQRIVDELLDLSRLQSGGWQPDLQEVEARELTHDVWLGCGEVAERKRITFAVTGGPARVVADPGGLRQVLSNLFDNAIRYTQEGGRVTVTIRNVPVSGNGRGKKLVELEVRDDGIGIPSDALPRIFERFFRVDPARSREQGGTGLGLSIVKHLVDRMSGEVFAESELGRGTSVRVRLPAAPAL